MIFLHAIILFAISWLFFKRTGTENPFVFWGALAFKMMMGAALGLVYLYYYSANDTWLFFKDATILANQAHNDFGGYLQFLWSSNDGVDIWSELSNTQERSLFLVKIISLFTFITGNNYWISALYFSLISFFASWNLFKVISMHFPQGRTPAAIAFLFFPSIVFWSSGLVKETLALAGIYFLTALFVKLTQIPFEGRGNGLLQAFRRLTWWEWLLAILSFYVAWNLKYYWTALFMAVVTSSVLFYFLQKRILILNRFKIISWLLIFILLSGIVSLSHPNFYLSRVLQVLITNHNDFVAISKDSGLIHYYNFTANWSSILINSPWALVSGLFRPFAWEATGVSSWLAAIENLFLLVFAVALSFRRKPESGNTLLLVSALFYIILLCVFLALSTPNLGTLSRYRVGFLPFFVFVITYRNPLLTYLFVRIRFRHK